MPLTTLTTLTTTTARLLTRLGSWKLWIVSAVIFIPFAWMFFASSASFAISDVEAACGQAPPDMRFFTTADGVTEFLDGCGSDGRDAYRNMQVADLFYPAIVGVFLASSLSLALRRLSPRSGRMLWLGALPLVASAFDYLENAFVWLALTSHPEPIVTSHLLGFASAAKTTLSWTSGLVLIAALVAFVVQAVRSRLSRTTAEATVAPALGDDREVMSCTS